MGGSVSRESSLVFAELLQIDLHVLVYRVLLAPNQSLPSSSQTSSPTSSRTSQVPGSNHGNPIIIPTTITTTAPTCQTIQDTNMPEGRLCISQLLTTTTTSPQPNCARYSRDCLKTVTQTRLLRPSGTALTNLAEFNLSAEAACKQLGYAAAGSGSVHITGSDAAARQLCW